MVKIIKLFDKSTTDFNNNGLVVLSDCKSCLITEELNGSYELELEYPLDERGKWQNLLEGNIIEAAGQLFRIYRKIKTLDGIKINGRHIFYDLLDNFLEDVRPESLNGQDALNWILSRTQYAHTYTAVSDVVTTNTKYFVRKNPVEAIMGSDGIISNWGGELYRNNFEIQLLQARGLDRGVLIAYGKNIQGIEETLDMDGLCTRLMPMSKDGLLLTEKYIDSTYINNFPHPIIKVVEFNDIDNETDLRVAGNNYYTESKCDIPKANYKIDFLELSKTEEYKNYAVLESVQLGDTVTVRHSKLNIDLKAKIIKTTKNILTDRLEKVELGNFKSNIASTMNNMSSTLSAITTNDNKVKGSVIQGMIDAAKASLRAMSDGVTPQVEKAIFFEDRDPLSLTYGALAIGTKGFMISDVYGATDWVWKTFGTGKGFIADLIIAGKILGLNMEINLDEGFIKITHSDGSYSKLDANGFMRHVGATDNEYHYLSYVGSTTITYLSSMYGRADVTITLPVEFKGKDFKVIPTVSSCTAKSEQVMRNLQGFGCSVRSQDNVNGTVTLHGTWFLDLSSIYEMTIAYTAIA